MLIRLLIFLAGAGCALAAVYGLYVFFSNLVMM
jgi:hypothetical protein